MQASTDLGSGPAGACESTRVSREYAAKNAGWKTFLSGPWRDILRFLVASVAQRERFRPCVILARACGVAEDHSAQGHGLEEVNKH